MKLTIDEHFEYNSILSINQKEGMEIITELPKYMLIKQFNPVRISLNILQIPASCKIYKKEDSIKLMGVQIPLSKFIVPSWKA